jgi:hypothetical protein
MVKEREITSIHFYLHFLGWNTSSKYRPTEANWKPMAGIDFSTKMILLNK